MKINYFVLLMVAVIGISGFNIYRSIDGDMVTMVDWFFYIVAFGIFGMGFGLGRMTKTTKTIVTSDRIESL